MLTLARARADPGLVRAALEKRRLARDGGAYALFLDESGATSGPLAGVPVAVKDIVDVAGTITRCGSPIREHAPPASADAPVVAALRGAGARLVGKTALVEFAFGATGLNAWEGTPLHPADPSRIPGGSSSGSAVAVAEGSCAAAIGTDTGGSVRIPAALCGVVGVKPSYGAVSTVGVFPLAPGLDHVGVLAADVASAREVLAVLAPAIARDGREPSRVGVDRRALEESAPEVARAVEDALRRSRLAMRDVTLPHADDVTRVSETLLFAEAAAVHRRTFAERRDAYGESVRGRIERGLAISAADYLAAREDGRAIGARVEEILREVDVIVGPTVGFVAPRLDEARAPEMGNRLVRYTRLWNVVGLPAISIPVPTSGLPVGLQLLALRDADALAAAAALEASLRWTR